MVKDDFINYRNLDREVRELKAQLNALCDPRGQRYSLTPKAPSGTGSAMDDLVASFDALEQLYMKKLTEKNARLLAIELAIESLDVVAERLVMRYRYIDGYSWRRICNTMQAKGYSERQVYRLHGFALEKLKEVET